MRFSTTQAFFSAVLLGLAANNGMAAPVSVIPAPRSLGTGGLQSLTDRAFRPLRPKPDEPDAPPANTIPKPGTSDPVSGGSGPVSGRPFGAPTKGDGDIGEDPPASPKRIPPQDMTLQGYVPERLPDNADLNLFSIKKVDPKTGEEMYLDEIEVDTTDNSIGIALARNKEDTTPDRLPLRQLALDLWVKMSGKSVGELKSINYQQVKNAEMKAAFKKVYATLGKRYDEKEINGDPVNVTPDMPEFDVLMSTVFGGGAKKMLDETLGLEGRTVGSISLFPDDFVGVQFNF